MVTEAVEEPEPLIVPGVKLADEPEGSPLTLKVTLLLKPFMADVATAYVPLLLICELGDAEIVKSAPGAVTDRVTVTVCELHPLLPVMVRV